MFQVSGLLNLFKARVRVRVKVRVGLISGLRLGLRSGLRLGLMSGLGLRLDLMSGLMLRLGLKLVKVRIYRQSWPVNLAIVLVLQQWLVGTVIPC